MFFIKPLRVDRVGKPLRLQPKKLTEVFCEVGISKNVATCSSIAKGANAASASELLVFRFDNGILVVNCFVVIRSIIFLNLMLNLLDSWRIPRVWA